MEIYRYARKLLRFKLTPFSGHSNHQCKFFSQREMILFILIGAETLDFKDNGYCGIPNAILASQRWAGSGRIHLLCSFLLFINGGTWQTWISGY